MQPSKAENFAVAAALLLGNVLREVKGVESPYVVVPVGAPQQPEGISYARERYQVKFDIQKPRSGIAAWLGFSPKIMAHVTISSQKSGLSQPDGLPTTGYRGPYEAIAKIKFANGPRLPVVVGAYANRPASLPMQASKPDTLDKRLAAELKARMARREIKL
jgi:hypothetical protein